MPSPLTSPAPATEKPLKSYASIPSRRKPFDAVERREIEARREAGGRAEHDVALAGVVLAVRDRRAGPDDQVVDAVAVDVARARDREAAVVVRVDPVEAEAVRCRRAPRDRGSPRSRRRCRRRRSSRRRRTCRPDRRRGPDDQVIDAVAVDVARARDRDAAVVVRVDPVEAEAVRAVERRRDRGSPRSRRRCRRRRSSRRRRTAVRIGAGAPMIRSSMPSPLTSPAPATETPL